VVKLEKNTEVELDCHAGVIERVLETSHDLLHVLAGISKYFFIILIGIGVVIVGTGLFYLSLPFPERVSPTAKENERRFDPGVIEVSRDDKIIRQRASFPFTALCRAAEERWAAKNAATLP
jgi:hypothetical protein